MTPAINAGIDAVASALASWSPLFTSAALAALIGVGALRVRGLLLAVSTFAFALAASQYLYRQPLLSGDFTDRCRSARGRSSAST